MKAQAKADRIAREVAQGRAIVPHAEAVWNWASPAGRRRAQRRGFLVGEAARLSTARKILELGCGTGLFTKYFASYGGTLAACDVSPDLLEKARIRSREEKNVILFRADAEVLPFQSSAFDAVVGSSVLHHLDVPTALKEIQRVLRPGGWMGFAEPNMLNPQVAIQKKIPLVGERFGETGHETAFLRWSLAQLMRRLGLVNVSVRPFDFLHPAVPARLVRTVSRLGLWLEKLPGIREVAGSVLIAAQKKGAE